jgi:hypothetical protein
MSGNGLVEDIVLRTGIFFEVKTHDLRSGDDGSYALFPSWDVGFEEPGL